MSDLTAQEVAAIRARAKAGHGFGTWSPTTVITLCDLAERAAKAEAKVERARAVLAALAEGVELANTHNADKRGTDYFDGAYAETQLFVKKLADLRRVLDNEGENDDE